MTRHIRFALFTGAALTLGAGVALAQMAAATPAPDMYGHGAMHGRMGERALRDFDLNKDGKITKAEMEKVLSQRYAGATGGKGEMSEAQFVRSHEKMLGEHAEKSFRRIDWNGDGVLSLDEFRAPLRARFEMADRDGSGEISCSAAGRPEMHRGATHGGMHDRHGWRHHGRGGRLAKLCKDADFNKDGKVTHAEADKAIADKYAATVKGGRGMTESEFYGLEQARFQDAEARRFKHLDKNHDGKLSEAEFAAPGEKLFARLDKNKDGTLTPDELTRPHHRGHDDHRGPHGGWDKKPG